MKPIMRFWILKKSRISEILANGLWNFQEYASILEELLDLRHLGFAIQTPVNFLGTLTEEQLDLEKSKRLSAMLLNFCMI